MAMNAEMKALLQKQKEQRKALEQKITATNYKRLMTALRKIYPAFSDEQIFEIFEKRAEEEAQTTEVKLG